MAATARLNVKKQVKGKNQKQSEVSKCEALEDGAINKEGGLGVEQV
jgi:hypothetical protein